MEEGGQHDQPDLAHIHWSFPEWINGADKSGTLIDGDMAMDYFALSPFFDLTSNNGLLRAQSRITNTNYGHAQERTGLLAFNAGIEYIIAHAAPPDMFLIHKREVRPNRSRAEPQAIYFILEGKVYPTPSLYDILATRLGNAAHLISSSFTALSDAHPPSNPRSTNVWRALPPSAASTSRPTKAVPASPALTAEGEEGEEGIEMGAAPEKMPASTNARPTQSKQPDWHLFHALQSTRNALPELNRLAKTPALIKDPMAELRAIETQLMSANEKVGSAGSVSGRLGEAMGTAVSPSVRFTVTAGTPGGTAGRAVSVAAVGAVGSPLASSWAPTPR